MKNNYQTQNPKALRLYPFPTNILMQKYVVLVGNQGMCYSLLGYTNYHLGLQCTNKVLPTYTNFSKVRLGLHSQASLDRGHLPKYIHLYMFELYTCNIYVTAVRAQLKRTKS